MRLLRFLFTLGVALGAADAWGHGFELTLNFNNSGVPVSISSFSQQPILDQDGTAPPVGSPMNNNLFLDQFYVSGLNTFTPEGGPNQISTDPDNPNTALLASWQHAGYYQPTMTFNLVSPLMYSDGIHGAVPASAGTSMLFSDAADGNPGTSGLHATLTGASLPPVAGWQLLSPYDTTLYGDAGHEIVKQLTIAPASTQTNGEYGFAFTVTAHFAGGLTVTSGPLVDLFATLPFGASDAQQDAATLALYAALSPQSLNTPEPASLTLALIAAVALLVFGRRKLRS